MSICLGLPELRLLTDAKITQVANNEKQPQVIPCGCSLSFLDLFQRLQNGSPRHHHSHLPTIRLGTVDILHQIQMVCSMLCCCCNGRFIQLLAYQRSLNSAGTHGLCRSARDGDACLCTHASAVQRDHCRTSCNSVVRSLILKLHIRRSGACRRDLEANLSQDLIRLQCGGEGVTEEIISRNCALAVGTLRYNIGFKCQSDGWQIARRV